MIVSSGSNAVDNEKLLPTDSVEKLHGDRHWAVLRGTSAIAEIVTVDPNPV
jgi:hypothetical protein